MNPSSYASAIAQLEHEIQDLDQRRLGVSVALDTLRALDRGVAISAPRSPAALASLAAKRPRKSARTAKRAAAHAKPAASAREKLSAERLAELKRCYSRGDNVEELAEALGVKVGVIYYQAKKGGWPRAGGTPSSASGSAAAKKKAAGTETPPRTCDSCYQRTRQDPCEYCGVAWKRSA